jgi:hypothetical protein
VAEGISLPMTMKCPIGGEEWVASMFRSFITGVAPKQTARTIHFACPAGHWFSLGEAVRAGMFTRKQKEQIVAQARELHTEYKTDPLKMIKERGITEDDFKAFQKAGRNNPDHPVFRGIPPELLE